MRTRPGPRHGVALLTLVAAAALALTGCGGGGSGSSGTGATSGAAQSSAPQQAAGGWSAVATFSGDDKRANTGTFAVHGGKVRFLYTVRPNDVGPVPLEWFMMDKGQKVDVVNPRASDECVSCDGQQTSDLGTVPAGSYYLHVITSRPWTLTVQEQQ